MDDATWTFELNRGQLLVVLQGRLDTNNCGRLSEPLLEALRHAQPPVVFDLAAVPFVASSFLRICLQAIQLHGSGSLHLRHLDPSIRKVFKIAGLEGPIQLD